MPQKKITRRQLLDQILANIVGYDLNPLAVISARTNYLLALGDLLDQIEGEIDIPVYLADSVLTPTAGEELDKQGKISVLAGLGKLLPVAGFDVAPASFGAFAGQIFSLAQGKVGMEGATANHVIQRIDPNKGFAASVFCTLPAAGTANQGISGIGVDARFGPEGGPFAGKFFAATAFNNAIYQVLPDGTCTPFVRAPHAPTWANAGTGERPPS